MAKRSADDPATRTQAEKMLAKVERMYELGGRAVESDAPVEELAASEGVTPRVLRQARQFHRKFSHRRDLDEILELRRPNGLPLHFNHLVYLMTVPHSTRLRWARKAAEEGWTAPDLHNQIKAARRDEGRASHGRPPEIPRDTKLAVQRLVHDAELWQERAERVVERLGQRRHRRSTYDEVLAAVRRLASTCKSVEEELEGQRTNGV